MNVHYQTINHDLMRFLRVLILIAIYKEYEANSVRSNNPILHEFAEVAAREDILVASAILIVVRQEIMPIV